ncbi:thioesterase-like superfamily-domain-containing protein [Aspergillus carlsbadensis]|nr:thioesterase-like superfamily-domain-containing protein [Aspergillus carlsbadensis]
MKPRRSKRAGRPRLAAEGDAVLSNDRRAQVRRAQKTYRQKKEAIFRDATARADRLEARMRSAREELVGLTEVAKGAQLTLSHPDIHARLMRLGRILSGSDELFEASPGLSSSPPRNQSRSQSPPRFDLDPQLLSLPMQQHTYAFQEPRLARQLQRYSLEHAYRLFTQSHSDPREMHRVFRLVPCVRDPSKTEPRFRQLLTGGHGDSLELLGLPFYGVGGAGTHFPDVDEEGMPIFPVNRRMPRRILGIVPDAELTDGGGMDEREQALVAYGLGGEWFDCRDVEGYLRANGVDVNGGLFPVQHMPSRAEEANSNSRSSVLNVEGFFSRLLSGLVILGRAPGFRKSDVSRALQASLKRPTKTPLMPSLKAQITVEPIDGTTDCYRSIAPPICMGTLADWAYGGNILAIAVSAAYATVSPDQHLYSISGYFVRPASPLHPLICRVERVRDTRTFQTRHLRVFQTGGNSEGEGEGGSEQLCLIATADFHIDEPAHMVMVEYTASPQLPTPSVPVAETPREKTLEPGLYSVLDTMMEIHPHGAALRIRKQSEKEEADPATIISAERLRLCPATGPTEQLNTEADQIAALAFYMDRGLAYIPANHSGYSLGQASACATLDFALRLVSHGIDLRDWHIGERQTVGAGNARALSEGRVFSMDGRLLANMAQTTILRAKKGVSKI